MTRIGTFVQLEPKVDRDAELFGMPDENGGIYLGAMKRPTYGVLEEFDVLMHLSRKEAIQLAMLLGETVEKGMPGLKESDK